MCKPFYLSKAGNNYLCCICIFLENNPPLFAEEPPNTQFQYFQETSGKVRVFVLDISGSMAVRYTGCHKITLLSLAFITSTNIWRVRMRRRGRMTFLSRLSALSSIFSRFEIKCCIASSMPYNTVHQYISTDKNHKSHLLISVEHSSGFSEAQYILWFR